MASEEFDPTAFRDEVYEKTLELIQRKVEGREITAAPVEESRGQIIDLMAALKASLAGGEARKPATRAGKKGEEKKPAVKKPAEKAPARKRKVAGE